MKHITAIIAAIAFGTFDLSASTYELSREQLMEIFRNGAAFCYELNIDGACSWVDYPQNYDGENVLLSIVGLPDDDEIVVEESSYFFWEGGRLCEVAPFTYASVVYYEATNRRYNFNRANAIQMPANLIEYYQTRERELFAGYECFAYEPARETSNADLIQVKYINGVRQPDVDRVTLISRSNGWIQLH